jgi:hypothetical protein
LNRFQWKISVSVFGIYIFMLFYGSEGERGISLLIELHFLNER